MVRKITAVLSCMALLAGCSTVPEAPKAASKEETNKTVSLTYYTWESTEQTNPIWADIKRDLNIDVNVKLVSDTGGNDKETAIDIAQMGGEDMDIRIITESSPVIRVQKSLALPLDDLIKKNNVDMKGTFGDFAQNVVFDGKTYGIPVRANMVMYMYNKDIFDKEGVPYPKDGWTWENYTALTEKLTKGEGTNKQYATCTNAFNWTWIYPAIIGGASYYNKDGYSNIDNPLFVNALKDYHEMDVKR